MTSAASDLIHYTYDALNRLKDATENITGQTNPNWKQTFIYDRFGNRTFDTNNGNTTTLAAGCQTNVCNPSANSANNRLLGATYDDAGNTTIDGGGATNGKRFIYDAENKQVQVSNASGIVGQYFYDGDGKRVKKIVYTNNVPSETTIFVYDASGKMVAEYSTVTANTPQVSYLTNDTLGSPRITTDANGQVISRRDFMPFGEEVTTGRTGYGADAVRQKFTGYQRDNESGLDYAKARMFGSSLGRFTSPDPLAASAKSLVPQSWNRYIYVLNNPLILTDPHGLKPVYYHYNSDTNLTTWSYRKLSGFTQYHGRTQTIHATNGGWYRVSSSRIQLISSPAKATPQSSSSGTSTAHNTSGGGYVNQELINQLANRTAPLPAATLGFAATATGAGVACAFLCPAAPALAPSLFGTGGVASAEYAATHPQETAIVTQKGLDIVTNHLGQFGDVVENSAMTSRLEQAMQNGNRVSGADMQFYFHELNEATLMGKGVEYEAAHAAALERYGVSSFDLYHPEVIQANPSAFNNFWFEHWGLTPPPR